MEKALCGEAFSPEIIARAAGQVSGGLDRIPGGLFAPADYRRAVAPVWVKPRRNGLRLRPGTAGVAKSFVEVFDFVDRRTNALGDPGE